MKRLCIVGILATTLFGCGGGGTPFHKVLGTDNLKVYHVSTTDSKYGKFEYWITDGTGAGWTLKTDTIYKLGDKLIITVQSEETRVAELQRQIGELESAINEENNNETKQYN